MKRLFLIITTCCLVLLLPAANSWASDLDDVLGGFDMPPVENNQEPAADELDEVLSGFGDDSSSIITEEKKAKSKIDISGSVAFKSVYNASHHAPPPQEFDHRGFSSLKMAAELVADSHLAKKWQARVAVKGFYDLVYRLRGKSDYSSQVINEYQNELEFGELWLAGTINPDLDIKIGRQIVVWGKSDNIRVTDILNPLDNREPGLVDIRDLRLPVTMTKLDYYLDNWNVSAMVIHEPRFNKEPVYGNDFYINSFPAPERDMPSVAFGNQELAIAFNGLFSGWDISMYGATLFDDFAHLEQSNQGARRRHSSLAMAGVALNVASGSWLLKGETAYLDGLQYSIDVGKKSRLDMLAGAEYSGFNETMLSVEIADRHIFSFDNRLKNAPLYGQRDEIQVALRASRDLFNDTLKLTALFTMFDLNGDGGSFERFSAAYDLTDALNLTGGCIFYQSGDKAALRNIGDNDRLFFEVRYHF